MLKCLSIAGWHVMVSTSFSICVHGNRLTWPHLLQELYLLCQGVKVTEAGTQRGQVTHQRARTHTYRDSLMSRGTPLSIRPLYTHLCRSIYTEIMCTNLERHMTVIMFSQHIMMLSCCQPRFFKLHLCGICLKMPLTLICIFLCLCVFVFVSVCVCLWCPALSPLQ